MNGGCSGLAGSFLYRWGHRGVSNRGTRRGVTGWWRGRGFGFGNGSEGLWAALVGGLVGGDCGWDWSAGLFKELGGNQAECIIAVKVGLRHCWVKQEEHACGVREEGGGDVGGKDGNEVPEVWLFFKQGCFLLGAEGLHVSGH